MKITSVKISLVPNDGRLKAYASIIIDDCFVVHDLKVIRTDNKLFVAMPSKHHKGVFRDIAHPLDSQTREQIQRAIFKQYDTVLNQFKETQNVQFLEEESAS